MSMPNLSHIGVAENNDKIIALITYENDLGEAYFCLDDEYFYLKPQLIDYAVKNLSLNGKIKIILTDGDLGYQQAAVQRGFIATSQKSSVARIDINNNIYTLPDGYNIMSFDDENFDIDQYYSAIWRGFDNKRERNEIEIESMKNREGFDAPYLDMNLRILVIAMPPTVVCGIFLAVSMPTLSRSLLARISQNGIRKSFCFLKESNGSENSEQNKHM